jgi:hypothetical protein
MADQDVSLAARLEQCRRKADEAIQLSEQTSSSHARKDYLALAEGWLELATEIATHPMFLASN